MKKMMKVLALTLIAMLLMSTAAMAEELVFEAANTEDTYEPNQEPSTNYGEDNSGFAAAYSDEVVNFGTVAPVAPTAPAPEVVTEAPAIAPEAAPAIHAEAPATDYTDLTSLQSKLGLAPEAEVVTIDDAPVPLSSGLSDLFVEIYADNGAPNYGDNVTLKSFVSYQGAGLLTYQWQINRGFGWENIAFANGADYTFNYNETMSNSSIRLFVDVMAA